MDDVRRHHDERPRPGTHNLEVRPDDEPHLAFDDVERVDVLEVHVRARAALAGLGARPARVEQLVFEQRAHRTTRPVGDRFAVVRN